MLGSPQSQIPLSTNYTIQTTQIIDLNNFMKNYMLALPQQTVALGQNYTVQSFQITDLSQLLSKYLLMTPLVTFPLHPNYTITTKQITDLPSYLLTTPTKTIALNTNYTITSAQITDLINQLSNYILQNPFQKTALNLNYTIQSSQITDFSTAVNALLPNLGNTYLLANPSQEIQFNANYSLAAGQIPDFSSAVLAVLPSQLNNYMLLSPTRQLYLNPNYYVLSTNFQTNSINPNILINNSITATQLQPSCVQLSTLNGDLQQFFKFGFSYSSTDTFAAKNANVPYPCVTQQYNSTYPIGFLHTNYNKYNGTNQNNTNFSYYGASSFFPFSNFNSYINSGSNPNPSIQFSANMIYGSNVQPSNYGSVGMYNSVGGQVSSITSSAYSIHIAGPSGNGVVIVSFGIAGITQNLVSYISYSGQYIVNSDENLKNNITEKTNYQEQLDKLLKVKIVTYSYGKNYIDRVQEIKQQLQDKGLNDDEKQTLQNELDALIYQQSRALQGYTYQNLKDCGFNYVIHDQQTMTDDFLQKQGIDKEKIQQKQKQNEKKTISETAMIPYVIMGIKALNNNIQEIDQNCVNIFHEQQQTIQQLQNQVNQQDITIKTLSDQNTYLSNTVQLLSDNNNQLKQLLSKYSIQSMFNDIQTIKNVLIANNITKLQ